MANPSVVAMQMSSAVANGIAHSQSVVDTTPLVLNGGLVTNGVAILGPYQRRVLAASSGADVGKTLTITGTNGQGFPISEVLTLASSPATTYTAGSFLTVTSIVPSGAMAGNITVGTNTTGSSDWVVDDFTHPYWALRVGVTLVSGSGTFSVEHTYDDPNAPGVTLVPAPFNWSIEPGSFKPPQVWSIAAFTSKTATTESGYTDGPIFAHRLTITAGTGLFVMQSIQSGIRGF